MINNTQIVVLASSIVYVISFMSCTKSDLSKKEKILKAAKEKEEVPVYSPQESIAKMEIVDGFEVKLVASEPLISSPIMMAFDNNMNMWVVELRGWVPIDKPIDKPIPKGRVSILFDTNNDGVMDSSKVFLDSLSMPRAI